MALVKNLNSDYLITNKITQLANITLATNTVYIDGNLVVGGNSTNVFKTDLAVSDNTIVLNKGEGGSGITLGTAGIQIDRGLSPNVSLVYNESYGKWTITNDGTTFGNITTSSGAGAVAIIDDPTPTLGGNLNTLARSIYSGNVDVVKFDDNLAISTTTITPTAIVNYSVIYAKTPESGGSGLYTTNTTNGAREIPSTRKAVVYSLVL